MHAPAFRELLEETVATRAKRQLMKPRPVPSNRDAAPGLHYAQPVSRWLEPYAVLVGFAAFVLFVVTVAGRPAPLWPIFAFVALAILAECWTVVMPLGYEISLSFPVYFAAAILFGPCFGIVTAVAATVLADGLVRRKGALKTAINAGQLALCTGLAGLTFAAYAVGGDLGLAANPVAYLAAAAAYIVVDIVLATTAFWLIGRPFARTCLAAVEESGVYFVGMGLLGALIVGAYTESPWTLLCFPALIWVFRTGFRLYARLGAETTNALVVLADTIDRRDHYTFEHSARVARHAANIATCLSLSADATELIVMAAKVHDLGKISIDNRILLKEGPIAEEERRHINTHPAAGAELAGQFGMFQEGAEIIRHHHERWDGTGYPDGLVGEQIPLGARIIAVADFYDALTSDRPYRAALSHETAVAALIQGRDSQFDGRVVEAFLADEQRALHPVPLPESSQTYT
jgi:HD-GYP domain-containing protein (c-di-GMP phosphodiesterase class II)